MAGNQQAVIAKCFIDATAQLAQCACPQVVAHFAADDQVEASWRPLLGMAGAMNLHVRQMGQVAARLERRTWADVGCQQAFATCGQRLGQYAVGTPQFPAASELALAEACQQQRTLALFIPPAAVAERVVLLMQVIEVRLRAHARNTS